LARFSVLGLLVPDRIVGSQGKGAGGVVLWAQVNGCCLRFFEPRLEVVARSVSQRRRKGSEFGISQWVLGGWMNDVVITIVDTYVPRMSNTMFPTNIVIRIMSGVQYTVG
jgi:hypothetical protein